MHLFKPAAMAMSVRSGAVPLPFASCSLPTSCVCDPINLAQVQGVSVSSSTPSATPTAGSDPLDKGWRGCWAIDHARSTRTKLVLRYNVMWERLIKHVQVYIEARISHDYYNGSECWRQRWREFPTAKFPFDWQLDIEELEVFHWHFRTLSDVNELLDYLPNVRTLRILRLKTDHWTIGVAEIDDLIDMIARLPLTRVVAPVERQFAVNVQRGVRAAVRRHVVPFPKGMGIDRLEDFRRGDAEQEWFDGSEWMRALFLRPPAQNVAVEVDDELRQTGAHMNTRIRALFDKFPNPYWYRYPMPPRHPYPKLFQRPKRRWRAS